MNRLLFILFCFVVFISSCLLINKNYGRVAGIKNTDNRIRGLIVPHHDVAQELIHQTLAKIRSEGSYKRIVIIGPNHYFPDSPLITTVSELPPYSLSIEIINKFKNQFTDTNDNYNIVSKEHSILTPIKYLSQYFPESEFVPLVVSTHFSDEEIAKRARYLASLTDTLFVVSVDFSHESTATEAINKNAESIKTINNFDYPKLYSYKDDHMDSPVSMSLFLQTMQSIEALEWETWFDSHSAILENNPSNKGTSYVLGVFR